MESWQIADLVQNAKGGTKSANILENGKPPTKRLATPSDPLHSPCGASAFDPTSTRLSMDFNIGSSDLRIWLENLDKWAFQKLLKESPRLFKRQVTKDELKLIYQPVIKKHEKNGQEYPDTVKTKFSSGKLRVWGFDHVPREPPASYKGCDLVPLVSVKNFWLSGNSCGLVLELTDIMVREQTSECPFLD